ncbi:hypothetical protein [Phytobacter sp. V91]|uniref:hypothetical protein n=1 Tax=Phytobacter sp. V91 TaxID=3369425 RepID=UPI003F61CCCB
MMSGHQFIAPGFCIVQQPGTLDFQARLLFNNIASAEASYFMNINKDTAWLKPGQILILADPNSDDKVILGRLYRAKEKVNTVMNGLNNEEANFLHRNFETIAAFTNFMDKSIGIVSDSGEKYFSEIGKRLKAIELSYQNQFRTQGSLLSEQFFV